MKVLISSFGGIMPRKAPHNLDIYQATIAHDVRLRNGRLEPWREKCVFAPATDKAVSFHIHGCTPVLFDTMVQVAETSVDWGRSYVTGHADYPEVMTFGCAGNPVFTRLGVPAPTDPLDVDAAEACDRDADARAYVYTYVNRWGEESAPSPVSPVVTVSDGVGVRVSGFAPPPNGYAIDTINLYRIVTGYRPHDVQQQKPLTVPLFVTALPISTFVYRDAVPMVNLGEPLETDKVQMPPADLRNIVSIDDTIRLAGTTQNKVHLSENFQLHNWPAKYEYTLDSNIVHMGTMNQKLFVTTDTIPYVINIADCEDKRCMPVQRCLSELPDIACKYPHSAIMTPYGYIYVAPTGLVLLKADATFTILTAAWFNPEEWQKLAPETARLGYYQGYVFIITDRAGFILEVNTQTYGDIQGAELSTISDRPRDLLHTSTGDLLMLEDTNIYSWDKGVSYREFLWESRELTGRGDPTRTLALTQQKTPPRGTTWSPSSAKVQSEAVEFTLITPLQDEAYKRIVLSEEAFRLPRVGRNLWYRIRLRGTHPVDFVTMGTSHFTVSHGQ